MGRAVPLTVREIDGVYVVSGELDLGSAEEFRREVARALDVAGEVILDLAGLDVHRLVRHEDDRAPGSDGR